jgi:hypothetical protein
MYSNSGTVDHTYVVRGVKMYMPESSGKETKSYIGSNLVTGQNEHGRNISLASPEPVSRIDSAISLCQAGKTDLRCDAAYLDPLVFNFYLENRVHVKRLDYSVFAQWRSVMGLLQDLECDGAVIEQLWDVREDMAICSGDWDARVRPGMEVDALCRHPYPRQDDFRWSSRNKDEDEETIEQLERSDNPLLKKHWWFERWRRKVEQEALMVGHAVQEPSRRMLVVGILSMATFLGVMLLFCTI